MTDAELATNKLAATAPRISEATLASALAARGVQFEIEERSIEGHPVLSLHNTSPGPRLAAIIPRFTAPVDRLRVGAMWAFLARIEHRETGCACARERWSVDADAEQCPAVLALRRRLEAS